MTKNKKKKTIDALIDLLFNNNVVYLVSLFGMNANETNYFRNICFEKNVKIHMFKNTLIKKAFEDYIINKKNSKLINMMSLLKNNSCLMFSNVNNLPAKIINAYIYKKFHNNPVFKGAYIEECFYPGNYNINLLSNLRSREELILNIIINLISKLSDVVSTLTHSNNLIFNVLNYLSKKK